MAWEDFDRPGHERAADGLRRVARYQRWMIAVVLGQLVVWLAYVALMIVSDGRGGSPRWAAVLTLILGAVGAVFVFLTALELRGSFAASVFGLATFVPCVGLLVIVLVNGYATTELRKHGIRVGFFGASPGEIRDRPSYYDDEDAGW
jgi:hypothetical protein